MLGATARTSLQAGSAARALSSTRSLLIRHAAGISVAIILALVLVAPRWWILATEPSSGARVPITVWGASNLGSDEALQTATIRQAYDGHVPVRAPHLVNHADASFQAGAFWPEMIGVLGHTTGGPFEALATVSTAMLVLGMLALYALALQLTGSRAMAVCVLPLALVWAHVVNQADGLLTLRHPDVLSALVTANPHLEFHAWTRFLAPSMTLATLFAAALILPAAVERGERRWLAASSILMALLVYSYIYYSTAFAAAVVLWLMWLLFEREFVAARRLLLISAFALLLALPELAILVDKSLSSSADVQARVGLDPLGIRFGDATIIGQRLLFGLPFLYVLRKQPVRHGLLIGLFLSPLVLTGVDGVMPQAWHYRSQVWAAFAVPALVAGTGVLVGRTSLAESRTAIRVLATAAALAAMYIGILQLRAVNDVDDTYAVSDDEYTALQWIESHVDVGETVVSPSIITNLLMSSLTPASGYIMGGYNPVASDSELADRYLRVQAAYGYDEQTTFERIDPANGFPFEFEGGEPPQSERTVEEHVAFYTFYFEIEQPARITDRFPEWKSRFRALRSESRVLGAYPAEYLYCGPRERLWPTAAPAPGTHTRIAFESNDVIIYQLTQDAAAPTFPGC